MNYWKEKESTDFITAVPTVFDETLPLSVEVSKYAVIARRSKKDWFVGAVTTWDPRTLTIPLNFLGAGNFEIEIFQDGANADRDAKGYKKVIRKITASESRLEAQHLVRSMCARAPFQNDRNQTFNGSRVLKERSRGKDKSGTVAIGGADSVSHHFFFRKNAA